LILAGGGEATSLSLGAEGIIQERFNLREVSGRVKRYSIRSAIEAPDCKRHSVLCSLPRAEDGAGEGCGVVRAWRNGACRAERAGERHERHRKVGAHFPNDDETRR